MTSPEETEYIAGVGACSRDSECEPLGKSQLFNDCFGVTATVGDISLLPDGNSGEVTRLVKCVSSPNCIGACEGKTVTGARPPSVLTGLSTRETAGVEAMTCVAGGLSRI